MNQLGIPVHVFVPKIISSAKHERLIANKASLTLFGDDCMLAENAARKYSQEEGIPFISPYNDIDVAAGQDTIGLEIFEELPDVDNVFVPVGGGGLIAGIAAYLKQVNPDIKVIGCQPWSSKVMYESIKAGTIIFEESQETLSDATSGGIEENSVIEGSAGVSLGAFIANAPRFAGQKSVVLACGANISMMKLKDIINAAV